MIRKRTEEIRKTTDDERLSYERAMANLPIDDDITTSRVGANGVPSEWISAPESASDRVILYLHGGGYVIGSVRTHRALVAHLARAAKSRVLALDYRLAPESLFRLHDHFVVMRPDDIEEYTSGLFSEFQTYRESIEAALLSRLATVPLEGFVKHSWGVFLMP